ncbi:MAG: hypothetical protein WBD81_11010 [Collimonas pratensis]
MDKTDVNIFSAAQRFHGKAAPHLCRFRVIAGLFDLLTPLHDASK